LAQRGTSAPDATLTPPAIFAAAAEIRARTARVRDLLREHLPHGAKLTIAEALRLRPESVTRQLDPRNSERLSEDVAILAQTFLEQLGQSDVAHEVRELRHAGLSTVAIMLPRGVDSWAFTVNAKTGEVR
jgi:hypothetical protein